MAPGQHRSGYRTRRSHYVQHTLQHCNTHYAPGHTPHTTHQAIHHTQQHICQVLQIPAGFLMESRCGTAAHNTWTRAHDHRAHERALVCATVRCARQQSTMAHALQRARG